MKQKDEMLQKNDVIACFTDGSRFDEKSGTAIVIYQKKPDLEREITGSQLGKFAMIFQAEIFGI